MRETLELTGGEDPVLFATVALSLPFKYHTGGTSGLTYSIPQHLAPRAHVGSRVLVPLGKQEKTGVIVQLTHLRPKIKQKLRPIVDVLDSAAIFNEKFLEWTRWVATYYLSSWGEVLAAALPEGLKPETRSRVELTDEDAMRHIDDIRRRAPRRAEILSAIAQFKGGVTLARLQKEVRSHSLYSALAMLEEQGLVKVERPLAKQPKIKTEEIAVLPDDLAAGSAALSQALSELERTAPKQANVLLALVQQHQTKKGEPYLVKDLIKRAGASTSSFRSLREKGLVLVQSREIKAKPDLADLPFASGADDISTLTLTSEQRHAIDRISEQLNLEQPKTFLLHGVTGSGKTEVYIALARKVLEEGGGVLILVPEIALTPQLIDRFKRRLSLKSEDEIAVLHSRMTPNERYAEWRSIVSGAVKIAIGARSAVFAPMKDLRLVIVDEEHEATFKQFDKTPRYNARDIAVVRASLLRGVCVLGSATPAVESYFNASEGKYELLRLTQRAREAKLPQVKIVDTRTAGNRDGFKQAHSALTPVLRDAIQERLDRREGIVLFQNRRGFSTYVECVQCGTPEMCPNCAVTMTFHKPKQQMRCHYCGFYSPQRTSCATCGSERLRQGGMGTQRVEDELKTTFPTAKIVRMDLDTTARKGAFKQILSAFASGKADILLGTQMVAKGLDFPRVTLVGVVSADTSLCLPDFRAGERTFQLLTQVSGRAGRSEELAGEVLIQTLQPGNKAILCAKEHDYETFYHDEIIERANLNYPPFSRLILIEFRGISEDEVRERAERFAQLFPERSSFYERIGPAPPAITKLRNEYRWHLMLKNFKRDDPNGEKIRRLISGALEQYQKRHASPTVKVTVDVDVQGVY